MIELKAVQRPAGDSLAQAIAPWLPHLTNLRTLVLLVASGAAIVRFSFWAFTGRVWEDALITVLHAENAVQGLGLTHFKVDEPLIHGFTSPLSVLIPLVGELINPGFGIDFLRIVSAFASSLVVYLAYLILLEIGVTSLPIVIAACLYLAIEHHQILWGMAGMETQVVVLVVFFTFWSLLRANPYIIGLAAALCLYARPDLAFLCAIVLSIAFADAIRLGRLANIFTMMITSIAIYLPWLGFCTFYYGSPIPNTILAKSSGYGLWSRGVSYLELLTIGYDRLVNQIFVLFGPSFGGNGTGLLRMIDTWGVFTHLFIVFILISAIRVFYEKSSLLVGMVLFLLVYSLYFVFLVPHIFGWYIVPLGAVGILLVAKGAQWTFDRFSSRSNRTRWAAVLSSAYIALIVGVAPTTWLGEKSIQHLVEDKIRVEIGRYIAENSPTDATIGGEPLGFVGYHSRRTYYDYPGLASRKVVKFLKDTGMTGTLPMLYQMHPEFLILRDEDIQKASSSEHMYWIQAAYEKVRRFEVLPEDRSQLLMPNHNVDLAFTLYRRTSGSMNYVSLEPKEISSELKSSEIVLNGDFVINGKYPASSEYPFSGRYFGSWRNSDENTGSLKMHISLPPGIRSFAIPFLTGTVPTDLSLSVTFEGDEQPFASLSLFEEVPSLPYATKSWSYWRVDLPAHRSINSVTISAEDKGAKWGSWFAIGIPRRVADSY